MKLFVKEHIPLFSFFLLQALLVPLLYWLTGDKRPLSIVLYGILLSMVVLLIYLVYRYMTHRAMYRDLADDHHEPFSRQSMGEAPLARAVHDRLEEMDALYQEMLHRHRNQTEQHHVFVHRWVHQMKTPISVIQLTLPELEDEAAGSIQEELDRLRKGLEMVIYTARLERFEQDFTVEPVRLLTLAQEAVASSRKLFIRKGIAPEFHVDEAWMVYTDAKWFRFMLDQILTNAVNYSGGPGKKVSFHAFAEGDRIRLEIRDQGIGIAKEDLSRVFKPYFTGERGRHYHESTGMGLYLVHEISNKLGHEVAIASEVGAGTTVTLTMRRASTS
jgi:signal transduction histidine kinase